MPVALALVAGLLLGGGAVLVLLRPILRERNEARAELRESERELAVTRAQLASAENGLDDRVRDALKAVSAEAYRETNETFLQLAGAKLDGTVKPLADSLEKVNEQVQSLDRARAQSFGALREQLSTLSSRTETLATALRAPHVRGRWGEIQLKRVVELAGMLPYCDFDEQVTTASDAGRLRPDLIVRLPGEKQVVVDAKVPLAAYLEAHEATDDETRARKLADHARQVREHLQKLSAKSYWQQFTDSPDYVVMFLPDEGFFRSAWEQDPELVELGVRNRVHIASPTTLIVLLQAIAFGWQQEKVAEDARTVHELGRRLYERLSVMGGHLAKVGASLDRAVGSYNQTVSSLESRVLVTARELEKHVSSDKEIEQLTPVASTTVALAAPELTAEGSPPLEIVPPTAA
ncbi:MAG: DNA recombination protein RmuC [Actinobacteria bacterium]|nr:MAG: DNA recombination protein RmuC [Actinomycetota bacterium]